MLAVARIAILISLCLPLGAQATSQTGSSNSEAQSVDDSQPAALPNAPSSTRATEATAAAEAGPQRNPTIPQIYEPLSNRQKFGRFVHTTVSPYTFASAA